MTARYIGILREAVYSPGRVEDDAAILLAVVDLLRDAGERVEIARGDDRTWPVAGPDTVVFTMAQGDFALERLAAWESRGVRVINSVRGVMNCQRHRTVPLLRESGVSFPRSAMVETAQNPILPDWAEADGAWVKRGDVHATEADDVVRAQDGSQIRAALARFRQRGVARVVIQQHVPGTVVKFYGVRGGFFFHVPPDSGLVLSDDIIHRMEVLGAAAARVLDVDVYGGDCVVDGGSLVIIDLNDWPSYARCRFSAAAAIAAHVGAQEVRCT